MAATDSAPAVDPPTSEAVEEVKVDDKPEKTPKEKKVKAPKEKKPKEPKGAKAPKVPTAHPTYLLVCSSRTLIVPSHVCLFPISSREPLDLLEVLGSETGSFTRFVIFVVVRGLLAHLVCRLC